MSEEGKQAWFRFLQWLALGLIVTALNALAAALQSGDVALPLAFSSLTGIAVAAVAGLAKWLRSTADNPERATPGWVGALKL